MVTSNRLLKPKGAERLKRHQKKGGILRVVKKAVVGLFAKVVTNPKTKKIATVVPIKGNLKDLRPAAGQLLSAF